MSILSDYLLIQDLRDDTYLLPITKIFEDLKEVIQYNALTWAEKHAIVCHTHDAILGPLLFRLNLSNLSFIWDINNPEYFRYSAHTCVLIYMSSLEKWIKSLPILKSDLPAIAKYKVYPNSDRFISLGTISCNEQMTVWTVNTSLEIVWNNFPIWSCANAEDMAKQYFRNKYPECTFQVIYFDFQVKDN